VAEQTRGPLACVDVGQATDRARVLYFSVSESTAGISCCSASSVPGSLHPVVTPVVVTSGAGRDETKGSERASEPEGQGQLDEMPFWWSILTSILYFSVEDRISTSFFVQTTRFPAHHLTLMQKCRCRESPRCNPRRKPRNPSVK
jgi:hypothetical protein